MPGRQTCIGTDVRQLYQKADWHQTVIISNQWDGLPTDVRQLYQTADYCQLYQGILLSDTYTKRLMSDINTHKQTDARQSHLQPDEWQTGLSINRQTVITTDRQTCVRQLYVQTGREYQTVIPGTLRHRLMSGDDIIRQYIGREWIKIWIRCMPIQITQSALLFAWTHEIWLRWCQPM